MSVNYPPTHYTPKKHVIRVARRGEERLFLDWPRKFKKGYVIEWREVPWEQARRESASFNSEFGMVIQISQGNLTRQLRGKLLPSLLSHLRGLRVAAFFRCLLLWAGFHLVRFRSGLTETPSPSTQQH